MFRAREFGQALVPPRSHVCRAGPEVSTSEPHSESPGGQQRPFASPGWRSVTGEVPRPTDWIRVYLRPGYAWEPAVLESWVRIYTGPKYTRDPGKLYPRSRTYAASPQLGVQALRNLPKSTPEGLALSSPPCRGWFIAARNHLDSDFGRFPVPVKPPVADGRITHQGDRCLVVARRSE